MTPPSGPLYWLLSTMANNLGRAGDLLVSVPSGGAAPIRSQLRLSSMTGNMLDLAATDFYGASLPRRPSESDASYRARIVAGLFVPRVTRAAIFGLVKAVTGIAPRVTEVLRPGDLGGYSKTSGAPTLSGGIYRYALATGSPPCGYGSDGSPGPLRWTHAQGGRTTPPTPGLPIPAVQTLPEKSQAFTAYLESAVPVGFGAQGNPVQPYGSSVGADYGAPVVGGDGKTRYASYRLGATSGYGGSTAAAWGTPSLSGGLWIYPAFASGSGLAYFGGWGTAQPAGAVWRYMLLEGQLALLNQLRPMVAAGIRCLVGFRAAEPLAAGTWQLPDVTGRGNWAI